ncbi:histidine phosphatase family protein [Clostridium uliginosum]|uniref:Broad specificity phosphatase PhoE n=1 Tax=Clostridium uliginosum TaxID=119641 RepID=A0A1I1MYE9_9CLOT|nr:histidine phosphatase family protein [Clostridium uliginosum]SFC90417.1 Broad specificity phosphatase PhoE [Clostridium uliginosum]
MRIGLVRHFKVNCEKKAFMTSKEFKDWETDYNNSEVTRNDVKLQGIVWNKCYASTLSRAITTAQDVYSGDIVKSDLIREVPINPLFKSNLKLPYWFWAVTARFAWYTNHTSQEEQKLHTELNAKNFVDFLESEAQREGSENILVVTHGFFMYTLQKELKKRGFYGKMVMTPQNGRLYLYKRD